MSNSPVRSTTTHTVPSRQLRARSSTSGPASPAARPLAPVRPHWVTRPSRRAAPPSSARRRPRRAAAEASASVPLYGRVVPVLKPARASLFSGCAPSNRSTLAHPRSQTHQLRLGLERARGYTIDRTPHAQLPPNCYATRPASSSNLTSLIRPEERMAPIGGSV